MYVLIFHTLKPGNTLFDQENPAGGEQFSSRTLEGRAWIVRQLRWLRLSLEEGGEEAVTMEVGAWEGAEKAIAEGGGEVGGDLESGE